MTDPDDVLPDQPDQPANLGRRLADHRAKLGWTQQELADRLAVSRVTVSHLEAGMSVPGERTIALLAGLFKVEPYELVAGTAYPGAKAERLPVVVARHTEVELQLALLDNDRVWLDGAPASVTIDVLSRWQRRLSLLADAAHDRHERDLLADAQANLTRWLDAAV
jgi:transcriptional regulator with XRE-family HTH domain